MNSTGKKTPKQNRLRRSNSADPHDMNESFFDKLMKDPVKRELIFQLLCDENVASNKYIASPLRKLQRRYQCESPTALLRRRALERQNQEKQDEPSSEFSSERSESRQSDRATSSCASPIPFNQLLKGVIAYVEVKSHDQDRSAGAKMLMSSMGATVRETFTKDVTHVIFKDGSFTTYQKAKLKRTHLLSVLWLEAIRRNNARVPEKNYPALGTDAYQNNVSAVCSQIHREYEDVIREEIRHSLQAGTPLPSTKSLIERRRTIFTPIPSAERPNPISNSQDREVENITARSRRTIHLERNLSPAISDDSDCGGIVNGEVLENNNVSHILEFIDNLSTSRRLSLQQNKQANKSNTDTDNSRSLISSLKSNRKLGVSVESSDMDITCHDTLNEETSDTTKSRSISRSNVGKEVSVINETSDTTKSLSISRSNIAKEVNVIDETCITNDSSKRNSSKVNELAMTSKTPEAVRSLRVLLTKGNFEEPSKVLSDKSDSIPSLRISTDKDRSSMSSLRLSAKDGTDSVSKRNCKKRGSTNTTMSSLRVSSGRNSEQNIVSSVNTSMSLLQVSENAENGEKGNKKVSLEPVTKDASSSPKNSTKDSFSPLDNKVISNILNVLIEDNITTRRKNRFNRTSTPKTAVREHISDKENRESGGAKTRRNLFEQKPKETPSKLNVEASSDEFQISTRRKNLRKTRSESNPTKSKTFSSDSHSTSGDSSSDSSNKKKKLRKLYNPDASLSESGLILSDDKEREEKRTKKNKQKSDKEVFIVPIVPKPKEKNKVSDRSESDQDLEEVLLINDVPVSSKRKKAQSKNEKKANLSADDEQMELAKEYVNRKRAEKTKHSLNKTTQISDVSRQPTRRKSAKISQRSPLKRSHSVRSKSSDESMDPIKTVINRRSTMEFQNLSQSVKKRLIIDKKKQPSMVCTKLHRSEVQDFTQIVKKLGGFQVEDEVSRQTTHLVAGEAKRTINMLRAMATGCWILKYEWVLKSLEHGKWLPEEEYELTEFSPAVQKCRLQRQAFGPSYTMDIFKNCGPIFIAQSSIPRCSDLRELVALCKGSVTRLVRCAKIVVGEYVSEEFVTCVKETWILDSITVNKAVPLKKYLIKLQNVDSPCV